MCDVRAQRAWSCSRYAVQQSQPAVGKVFKFSVHSSLNDALHSPFSMLNAWKMCPWKSGGGQAGGGGVQDTTNTGASRVGLWVELHPITYNKQGTLSIS